MHGSFKMSTGYKILTVFNVVFGLFLFHPILNLTKILLNKNVIRKIEFLSNDELLIKLAFGKKIILKNFELLNEDIKFYDQYAFFWQKSSNIKEDMRLDAQGKCISLQDKNTGKIYLCIKEK